MYRGKKTNICRVTIHSFRHPLRSWNVSPEDKGGLLFFSLVIRLEQVLKVELNFKLGVKVNFEKKH